MNKVTMTFAAMIVALFAVGAGCSTTTQTTNKNTAATNTAAEGTTEDAMEEKDDEVMEKETEKNSEDAAMEKEDDDDSAMEDDNDSMEKDDDDAMMEEEDTAMEKSVEGGEYVAYDESLIARAENGDVVLYFNAPWCPTCVALQKDIEANLSDIPEDLTILKLDYDTETALRKKYGVTYQHTFVQVDTDGNEIAQWSGSPTLAALIANVQ